jgi:predicted GNAT family acetyltransferase
MAVTPRKTKNTVSIGAVYTAPAHRKNSYASGLVAALSQKMLDTGFQKCVLVTDLANATSNKIYQNIGYKAFCDIHHLEFV